MAFVNLLIDFGANLNLVKWETLGEGATGRIKVNPEALQVFKEARSEWKKLFWHSYSVPSKGVRSELKVPLLGLSDGLNFHWGFF